MRKARTNIEVDEDEVKPPSVFGGAAYRQPREAVRPPCVGCGGEKFQAKTPADIESVLRQHIQE